MREADQDEEEEGLEVEQLLEPGEVLSSERRVDVGRAWLLFVQLLLVLLHHDRSPNEGIKYAE